ncbi:MAG: hypothetical protein HXY25_01740 [Alphaproteobacteria bacterium]|nr:hypothetical protein [Alphaproteobacteria bacterium]
MRLSRHRTAHLLMALVIGLGGPGPLAGAARAQGAERFTLEKLEDGAFIRLDRETGQISRCGQRGTSLVCEAAADDLELMRAEVARLDADLAEARAENRRLRTALDEAGIEPPEGTGGMADQLPSEDEMKDFADWFAMMGRVFRDMLDDLGAEEPEPAPAPDRRI